MNELLQRLVAESSILEFVAVGSDLKIMAANPAFVRHVDVAVDELLTASIAGFMTDPDADRVAGWVKGGDMPEETVRLNFVAVTGSPFTLRCAVQRQDGSLRIVGEPETTAERSAAEELMRLNNELATVARERARRERELERTRRELQATLDELETSYWHLKKLQQVLPLCMSCGKVKTDEARWQSVVDYLKENEIFLSHGYCPGCARVVLEEHGLEAEGTT